MINGLKPPLGEMGERRFPPAGGCGAYGAAAEAYTTCIKQQPRRRSVES